MLYDLLVGLIKMRKTAKKEENKEVEPHTQLYMLNQAFHKAVGIGDNEAANKLSKLKIEAVRNLYRDKRYKCEMYVDNKNTKLLSIRVFRNGQHMYSCHIPRSLSNLMKGSL